MLDMMLATVKLRHPIFQKRKGRTSNPFHSVFILIVSPQITRNRHHDKHHRHRHHRQPYCQDLSSIFRFYFWYFWFGSQHGFGIANTRDRLFEDVKPLICLLIFKEEWQAGRQHLQELSQGNKWTWLIHGDEYLRILSCITSFGDKNMFFGL